MPTFADALDPLAPSTAPPLGISGMLSSFFGGDPTGAYQSGLNSGSQYRLRSAQTESALAEAEKRRQEALRQTQINDLMSKASSMPGYQPTIADMLVSDQNPQQFGLDPLSVQEQGFRGTLGDPNADPAMAFAAGQGVQGKVLPRLYDVGGETVNMNSAPDATFRTPMQQKDMQVKDAQIANYQERSVGAGGKAGGPLVRSSPIGPVQSVDGGATWNPVLDNSDVAGFNAARTGGAAVGQKQAALYANLNNMDAFTATVDEFMAHPGFETIYGMSSIADPRNYVRGTDAKGAEALRGQLNSRSFLASIQSMRGMGQLSNQEGAKVETALTAALQPGLSDVEAVQRLNNLKTTITGLRQVAEQEAGATENSLTPPTAGTQAFQTIEQAEAANLPPGTRITIGGRAATVQ